MNPSFIIDFSLTLVLVQWQSTRETGELDLNKMAARNRRVNVPDVDNTIDLVQVDGLVCK